MSTPRTDAAWDAFNRGACGMGYLAHEMRQLETELNAKNAAGSPHVSDGGNDADKDSDPSASAALDNVIKKPRLFYYEEAENIWTSVPDSAEDLLDITNLSHGEKQEIEFQRVDLTDHEFANLPEI